MANPCSQIKWADCVRISEAWIEDYLQEHPIHSSAKLTVRAYSLLFSGTQQQFHSIVDFISDKIADFVLPSHEVAELNNANKPTFKRAAHYFGDTDPEKDGKYGELLLFLLTETVLKVPMVAHKMTLLTNTKDQVKGGDGIYFGEYNGQTALLIGESKIEQTLSKALSHALDSLDRFHGNWQTSQSFHHELIVASQILRQDLSIEQLDYLYKSFKPNTKEYRANILVHPVLIVYKPVSISCAYRCPSHNEEVGGVPNSQHVKGCAADVLVPDGMSVDELAQIAEECGADGIGKYYDSLFVHVDTRGETARWDDQNG